MSARDEAQDFYEEVAQSLDVSREVAKSRVLAAAYGKSHASYKAKVHEFHRKFGLDYEGPPRALETSLALFRVKFMVEELAEYCRASGFDHVAAHLEHLDYQMGQDHLGICSRADSDDLHGQLDALVDLVYVACGTAVVHGFDLDGAFDKVHEANMRKVRVENVEDSRRKSTFDVVKPPGWEAPNLSEFLK